MHAGIRYVFYSHSLRAVLIRTFAIGIAGGSVSALMPLVVRELSNEAATAAFTLLIAACVTGVALSPYTILTVALLTGAGVGWMVCLTFCNVAVQTAVPRWVTGRAVAAFQTAIAGGLAIGSWLSGQVAQAHGVSVAMLASAVALALTGRSGPIILEIEYRIDAGDARTFYHRMQAVRAMRLRNGTFDWSISRDTEDPEYWFERYYFPTWFDYLRQRSRTTPEEQAVHELAARHHRGDQVLRVLRLLERRCDGRRTPPITAPTPPAPSCL